MHMDMKIEELLKTLEVKQMKRISPKDRQMTYLPRRNHFHLELHVPKIEVRGKPLAHMVHVMMFCFFSWI